jgi:hypothetical protein
MIETDVRAYQGGDVAALHTLNMLQSGLAAPQTSASLTAAMDQLTTLGNGQYAAVKDAALRATLDQVFASLVNLPTCYGLNFPAIYTSFVYGQYLPDNHHIWGSSSNSMWPEFVQDQDGSATPWQRPAGPASWRGAIDAFLAKYPGEPMPPPELVDPGDGIAWDGGHGERVIRHQLSRIDPAHWKDSLNAVQAIASLWDGQEQTVRAALGKETLQSGGAIQFLYCVLGLASGSPRQQSLAYIVASAPSSSPENPNAPLLGQLASFVLMAMIDPLGGIGSTNPDLQAWASQTASSGRGETPIAQLVQGTFTEQAKILRADPSYPMQDPYNPATGFDVRKTDALAAINATLKKLEPLSATARARRALERDRSSWSAGDLATYADLLRLEHNSIVSPTRDSLWDFMKVADTIGRAFNGIGNANVQQTVERVFNDLVDTPTSYQVKVPALFLGSAFGRWALERHPANNEAYGDALTFAEFAYSSDEAWNRTPAPPKLSGAIDDLLQNQWGPDKLPSATFWAIGARTFGDIAAFQKSVLDPAKWTDAAKVGDVLGKTAAAQASEVRGMLASSLTLDACVRLLYLLFGMFVAAPKERQLAGTIVAALVDSPEYPNDVFANQLVYAAAMALIDPDGDFTLTHDALKATLQTLHGLPRTSDPGTAALVQALRHHINVLNADPAYPLTDPYAASVNFPVRKADTLAALNAAWKGLRP